MPARLPAFILALTAAMFLPRSASSQPPSTIHWLFPAGGQRGQSIEVQVGSSAAQTPDTLLCSIPSVSCERLDVGRFKITIPSNAPLGHCHFRGLNANGISAPRSFIIGNQTELPEIPPNNAPDTPVTVPVNVVINGKIGQPGETDVFRFPAKQGQLVVLECWSERIDSRLRAMLEVSDAAGKRLANNRGYFGIDPAIPFHVPADGEYTIKIHDLTAAGSDEHYYRLSLSTAPRIVYTVPSAVERGKPAKISLFGWNLQRQPPLEKSAPSASPRPENSSATPSTSAHRFTSLDIEISADQAQPTWPPQLSLPSAHATLNCESFSCLLPDSSVPFLIGLTDVPIIPDQPDNHSPESAQLITAPCEISGQLAAAYECDWFAVNARRGEVLYLEGIGERIQSPLDLQLSICDLQSLPASPTSSPPSIAQFADQPRNIGGAFRTSHLDPSGRWVAPADGRYGIAIRNLIGGIANDQRRNYRLSIRREEPAFQIVAIPRRDVPAGLNIRRGGRESFELLVFRQRGFTGAIQVVARNLPSGIECPDVWIGPDTDQVVAVVSADQNAIVAHGLLQLEAIVQDSEAALSADVPDAQKSPTITAAHSSAQPVRAGTIVRAGSPVGWGQLVSDLPFAVTSDAPLRISADAHETLEHHIYGKLQVRHAPGGMLDVAVQIERRDEKHQAPVKLIGDGVPQSIPNQTAVIPAGQSTGYLSFYLPPTLEVGRYSLVIKAETTVPAPNDKHETVTVCSNPVVFDVQPAAFLVEVDPFAIRRAKRGETIQIGYAARRINGFIGKMHTELAVPGRITDVPGLRGRGETFVGQSETGSLQIVVNSDAPIGPQKFLRLFTVGVVEDEPIYHGSSVLNLEIEE